MSTASNSAAVLQSIANASRRGSSDLARALFVRAAEERQLVDAEIQTEAEYDDALIALDSIYMRPLDADDTRYPVDTLQLLLKIESEMRRFDRRLLLTDRDDLLLARYLLWSKRFTVVDPRVALQLAANRGILRQSSGDVFVFGLHRGVANPAHASGSRRVDSTQGRYRGRQAFRISVEGAFDPIEHARFMASLPAFLPHTSPFAIGHANGFAKPSTLDKAAQDAIYKRLVAINYPSLLQPVAPIPASHPAPATDHQLSLFPEAA